MDSLSALVVLAIAAATSLDASYCDEQAQKKGVPSFAPRNFGQVLTGFGGVTDSSSPLMGVAFEGGHRPFAGALSTGYALASSTDTAGQWFVLSPGLLVKLDLTYVFLSGFWSHCPSPTFPLRVQVGTRIGFDISESFGVKPSYWLVRPDLQPHVDLELVLDSQRKYALVGRLAMDTTINLEATVQWIVSFGISFGWGHV